jgi:regulator of RNase E activity RraA
MHCCHCCQAAAQLLLNKLTCHVVSTALRCVCCQAFEQPGNGRVLVVDGGGSKRCALLGDNIAEMAHKNGWSVSCWPARS